MEEGISLNDSRGVGIKARRHSPCPWVGRGLQAMAPALAGVRRRRSSHKHSGGDSAPVHSMCRSKLLQRFGGVGSLSC